jgi:hypothetical protein
VTVEIAPEEMYSRKAAEVDIGVGLNLKDQLELNSQREKNDIFEKISTNLEDIVLKINTISE